ncbi:MAG: flagellar basal body P-ring protein FlgI [Phycisphaerae bacterium]
MTTVGRYRRSMRWSLAIIVLALATGALAEVRVQDIARLQGQRINQLMGYGLVVGLDGTGDGGKEEHTMRALMAIHRKFHQPVLSSEELKNADNVALVAVEVTIPEFGAREGQRLDVVVSAFKAKSLAGGQLLTTPLQFALFDEDDPETQQILAFAGGRIDIPDPGAPARGIIRNGCTLEADFFYNFILDGYITLVLDDEHAGFQWAQLVARAISHELKNPAMKSPVRPNRLGRAAVAPDFAEAIGPKNVRVRVPPYELPRPAGFISRVLQTHVFMTPQTPARVCINHTTGHVSFTGSVTISPTVLQLPGLGTVAVGGGPPVGASGGRAAGTKNSGGVEFQELLNTLSKLQLAPEQMVEAIEHLHHTGTLHAQLVYTE